MYWNYLIDLITHNSNEALRLRPRTWKDVAQGNPMARHGWPDHGWPDGLPDCCPWPARWLGVADHGWPDWWPCLARRLDVASHGWPDGWPWPRPPSKQRKPNFS